MALPTALTFGGQKYTIKFIDNLKSHKKSELLGLCVFAKNEIHLDPNQGLSSLKSTLLHESVHAMANAMDWDAKEATVVKVEKLIYAMVKENPHLFRWLLEKEKPNHTEETL